MYFPKWGIANGKEEIARWIKEVGRTITSIVHRTWEFHYVMTGTDLFAIEGTTHGVHKDGSWSVGDPEWFAGRWCDVFEVRDWKIQRCFKPRARARAGLSSFTAPPAIASSRAGRI